jgi:hypothetical protein
MNQGNRPPVGEERGDDNRDSRDDKQRDRNRQTPAVTTNPAVQTSPPGVTAPTYAGTPPAVTVPGTAVDIPIDNTNVKASPPVAEALQKQIQNVAMNAIDAYKGTAGEVNADHPPAIVDDMAKLNTGDYVQYERFSAFIVRDRNGQLNILDNGHLVPFDPNNPPLVEKYGNFQGYFHPTGLDVGNTTPESPPPPTTVSAAQQPGGPPPVGPPQV